MHKYKPRVHIIRHDPRMDLSQIQSLPAEGVHSFSFPETEFTTVTAYQNQQVTLTETVKYFVTITIIIIIITNNGFDRQALETSAFYETQKNTVYSRCQLNLCFR